MMMRIVSLLLLISVADVALAEVREDALPAIGQVVTMLSNIAAMVQTEGQTDEAEHNQFLTWESAETTATETHRGQLQTSIQTTNAILSDLYSQRTQLTLTLTRLAAEESSETQQLNDATARREQENSEFLGEQQNFENAISACVQAVEILSQHYGDGSTQELVKPEFLSLLNKAMLTIRESAKKVSGKNSRAASFLQNPNFDTYKKSTGEALNIVDQVHSLSDTFKEDKLSAVEQESQLQSAYETLRTQKQAMIATLKQEHESETSQLNLVKQNAAEKEGKLSMDQQTLEDKNTYLTQLANQLSGANSAYATRSADRAAEFAAVKQAMAVLERVTFLQQGSSLQSIKQSTEAVGASRSSATKAQILKADFANFGKGKAWATRIALHAHKRIARSFLALGCKNCKKVAVLLRAKATLLHSETLATAAASASENTQLRDVVTRLEELVANLDAEQNSETEHKQWCETEISRSVQKRDGHSVAIDGITQTINSMTELISMKEITLGQNQQDINDENGSMAQQKQIRENDHSEYESDLQDTNDAIAAMTEATGILAKFYQSSQSVLERGSASALVQVDASTDPKSGSQVVQMMTAVRQEFDRAAAELRQNEQAAVTAHTEAKAAHLVAMNDLQHARGVLSGEKQIAEQTKASNEEDLTTNQDEKAAAITYLSRLGNSCQPLIEHYDDRVKLRSEEKTAIQQAITTLQEV